jgi:hypothetical protein
LTRKKVVSKKTKAAPEVERLRTFSVRLPESSVRELKRRANETDRRLQSVLAEAVSMYLSPAGTAARLAASPLGELTDAERRLFSRLLVVVRGGDANMGAILKAVSRHAEMAAAAV